MVTRMRLVGDSWWQAALADVRLDTRWRAAGVRVRTLGLQALRLAVRGAVEGAAALARARLDRLVGGLPRAVRAAHPPVAVRAVRVGAGLARVVRAGAEARTVVVGAARAGAETRTGLARMVRVGGGRGSAGKISVQPGAAQAGPTDKRAGRDQADPKIAALMSQPRSISGAAVGGHRGRRVGGQPERDVGSGMRTGGPKACRAGLRPASPGGVEIQAGRPASGGVPAMAVVMA